MSEAVINPWFSTLIYRNKLDEFSEKKVKFIKKAYDLKKKAPECQTSWRCNTYNTLNVHNIIEDKLFENLIKKCEDEVTKFAREYGVIKNARCSEGWINIAQTGEYQEFHTHPNYHFSLVYYLKTPKECGNIRFKSPFSDIDMFPLPVKEYTHASFSDCSYTPEEDVILIFRSYQQHMVEINKSLEDRISIAMNFVMDS